MTVTVDQLTAAYTLGQDEAYKDCEYNNLYRPEDNPYGRYAEDDYEARKDVLFRVTGEKLEPDSEDGWLIMDNFENGYYDYWEDVNNAAS